MMRAALLFSALLLLASGPAPAAPVREASLPDLCRDARTIVAGRVVAVRAGRERRSGLPLVEVTLRVESLLKNADAARPAAQGAGREFVFRQYHPPSGGRGGPGLPQYREGEDVVLFLAGTSRLGLTAPIGLAQGKFTVTRSRKRGKVSAQVANAMDNANLASAAPAAAARRGTQLTPWERDVLERRVHGPVDYDGFLRLVRKLVRAGRVSHSSTPPLFLPPVPPVPGRERTA